MTGSRGAVIDDILMGLLGELARRRLGGSEQARRVARLGLAAALTSARSGGSGGEG